MCGICGFVTKREMPNGSAILERMVATLRHRGPDACGIWVKGMGQRAWGQEQGADEREGCAGSFPFALCSPPFAYLGHTRLAVLDLSEAGRQPMPNEDGSVWIVYNGEVYNFAELRAELERRGHRFRSRTDTEVLLHAYEEWGVEFVKRLQGMFAFAIWDSREGQRERGAGRLLLVRDRLGIKPLYYAFLPDGTLVFGSELKAILEYPEVPREVDPVALDAYFAYGYIPAPLTIYRAIRKLPPAHYLVWQEGQISLHRYWHLDYTRKRTESPEALAEELRQRLRETVKLHLISDVPLGAFLSGGMDSSTIVALMAQVSNRPVKTFSIGFEDDRFNELPYARLIAQRYGTEHHEFIVTAPTATLLFKLLPHFGEPFADSSALPTFAVSQIAREHVAVVLSGDGGDEIFAGYEWTRRALLLARMKGKSEKVGKRSNDDLTKAWAEAMVRHGTSWWHRLVKAWRDWWAGPLATYQRRTRTPFLIRQLLYAPELRANIDGLSADRLQDELLANAPVSDWREAFLYCDTMLYLPDDCLTKVDRMSMAVALEVRPPFLDHTIVEFAASLPFDLKWRNGTTKWLVKRAMARDLPEETMRQRKQGFSVPVARWMRGALADELLKRLRKNDPFLDGEAVQKMVALHREGTANFGHLLWRLYVWLVWQEVRAS